MPYVSPIPLGSDVQIMTGLIGYVIIAFLLLKDKFIISHREITIILLGLFFLVYVNVDESTYQFRKAIGPIYGFSIYYIAKNYKDNFNIKILNVVLSLYFLAAVVQFVSPGFFELTFENFIRVAKYSSASTRGLTSLTTEPGFLGTICIYIILIQDWYYKNKGLSKDRQYYVRLIAATILILLSKSGAGYILLFLLLAFKSLAFIKRYWYLFTIAMALGIVIVLQTDEISGNKGLSDLVKVLQSSSPQDLLKVSSLSMRVNPILVGIQGAIEEPLGRGSGAFTTQASMVYLQNNIDQIYPFYLRDRLLFEISLDSVSTFGKYIFEYGVFFLLYLFLIFIGLNVRKSGVFIFFLLLTGLAFALPIVYPPIWLIFGLYSRRVKMQ